jgi:hypothetical protein
MKTIIIPLIGATASDGSVSYISATIPTGVWEISIISGGCSNAQMPDSFLMAFELLQGDINTQIDILPQIPVYRGHTSIQIYPKLVVSEKNVIRVKTEGAGAVNPIVVFVYLKEVM